MSAQLNDLSSILLNISRTSWLSFSSRSACSCLSRSCSCCLARAWAASRFCRGVWYLLGAGALARRSASDGAGALERRSAREGPGALGPEVCLWEGVECELCELGPELGTLWCELSPEWAVRCELAPELGRALVLVGPIPSRAANDWAASDMGSLSSSQSPSWSSSGSSWSSSGSVLPGPCWRPKRDANSWPAGLMPSPAECGGVG